MEFRVLGRLEVRDRHGAAELGTPRIRAMCGILLVRPGGLVPVEQFVDELWPDDPPPNARALVRGYVSRLRRALSDGADRVVSRKPGYLLRVEDQELDLHCFERLVTEARAAGDPGRAAELFDQAHRLWRGEPYADVPRTASIAAAATWLTEQRLAVMEERFDAALAAGQDTQVITELTEFVTAHPLRERPAGQLMRALYRCGRQAEALSHYQLTRRALAEEVGVEPSAGLRQLHQRILNADPTLGAQAQPVTVAAHTPRQLPRDLATFVGRDSELADLNAMLVADEAGRPGPVVVIHGAPGVGKSALAVRAAHTVAHRYPDGQLHVNLRGGTTGIAPLSPTEALHRLLRALGVAATEMPPDVEEAAGLFRTVLANRRLVILLDNAATAAQVRPLLPGGHGNAVLVTSRTRLTTLEGVIYRQLDPLSPDAAHAMLDSLVSDARMAAEPDTTRRLAELCDHLPLGLHVAAARLNARPSWAVRDLVDRLLDQCQRLTELAAGDIAVRGSLTISHSALQDSDNPVDQAAARALCLFGLLPVTGIDLDLAAAVLDADRQSADRIIERLLDAHLVEETAPDRYHMHDLIRLLARELAADTGLGGEQDRAFTRVLGHYLATVGRANTLAYPHRSHPPVPAVDLPPAPLADRQDAQRWLDDQRRNVIAVVRDALTGSTEHARLGLHLGLALNWHLHTEGAHIHETIGFYEDIVDVAIRLGERHSEAHAHYCLAVGLNAVGQPDTARTHHTTELAICRELGDSFGEQRALGNLGATHLQRQSPSEAIPFLQRQLELATDIDAPVGRVFALLNLGKAHHQLGHLDDAVRLLTEALRWYEKAGDHLRQCDALELLARVHIDLGQHDRAIALMTRGLDEARHIGYRLGEIWALTVLARARRLRGDTRAARQCAEQAVAISDDLRHTKARRDALDEYELLAAVTRS